MRRRDAPMTVIVYAGEATSDVVVRSDEHDEDAWCSIDEARARMPPRLFEAVLRALDQG